VTEGSFSEMPSIPDSTGTWHDFDSVTAMIFVLVVEWSVGQPSWCSRTAVACVREATACALASVT
jgi:hypothetical protein